MFWLSILTGSFRVKYHSQMVLTLRNNSWLLRRVPADCPSDAQQHWEVIAAPFLSVTSALYLPMRMSAANQKGRAEFSARPAQIGRANFCETGWHALTIEKGVGAVSTRISTPFPMVRDVPPMAAKKAQTNLLACPAILNALAFKKLNSPVTLCRHSIVAAKDADQYPSFRVGRT